MRKKIENRLLITCSDIDLMTLTNIEFYVKQIGFEACYTPTVVSSSEMLVVIPFKDARTLKTGEVKLQFAFTDLDGNPDASDVVTCTVEDLLKEAGYDPVRA